MKTSVPKLTPVADYHQVLCACLPLREKDEVNIQRYNSISQGLGEEEVLFFEAPEVSQHWWREKVLSLEPPELSLSQ